VKWVGLDVAKDSIAVAVLDDGEVGEPRMDRVAHDEATVRRLVGRLGTPGRLRVCYEAGPTGYELHRLLGSMGVACEVIAPSLVPVARFACTNSAMTEARTHGAKSRSIAPT
jgi:transposase